MKFVGSFLRVLAAVFAIATLAAFFFPFVDVALSGVQENMNGFECTWGTDLTAAFGEGMTTYKSGYYIGSLVLTILTAAAMIAGLFSKKKGWNGTAIITGILNCILLVSFIAKGATAYVDMGHVTGATVTYALGLTLAVVAAIASTVMCVAGVLVTDAAECKESGKLTIIQKVLKFLREYKSELKKVVWPGPHSVVKNTLVVLGVCGVALLIIWLVDMGLFKLFELCFGA
jgi:preprotein translocase subunit SecE